VPVGATRRAAPGEREFKVSEPSQLGLRRMYRNLGLEPIAVASQAVVNHAEILKRDILTTDIPDPSMRRLDPIGGRAFASESLHVGGLAALRNALRVRYAGKAPAVNPRVIELADPASASMGWIGRAEDHNAMLVLNNHVHVPGKAPVAFADYRLPRQHTPIVHWVNLDSSSSFSFGTPAFHREPTSHPSPSSSASSDPWAPDLSPQQAAAQKKAARTMGILDSDSDSDEDGSEDGGEDRGGNDDKGRDRLAAHLLLELGVPPS
jgi:hypothetical protein